MHSDKKITKEDTWKPSDLKRHIREEGYSDDYYSKQDSNERKHRSGDSKDKQHKDLEKESRRDRDKHREQESTRDRQESTRDRQAHDKKDKYAERRKEGSRDRRGNREKDRRDERDSEKRREKERQVDENKYSDDHREKRRERERLVDEEKYSDDYREKREKRRESERLVDEDKYSDDYRKNRDRRRDREDKHNRDIDKERHRVKEKDKVRDIERYNDEDREKRREEGDKEKRREQRDREHRTEKKRHDGSGEERKDWIEKSDRDQRHRERDRHRGEYEDRTNEKERHKKHGDRKHSEEKEQREYKVHRTQREEREQRHKERKKDDEKLKNGSDSLKKQDLKASPEEVRHCRGDRERAEWDILTKDKRHRKGKGVEKKLKGRRLREGGDPENKQREGEDPDNKKIQRSQREGEDPENKKIQISQREGEDPYNKQRERSQREGQNHRDRSSSKRLSSDKSHRHERNTHKKEDAIDEDLGEQEYENDFEDYEEDFEEVGESADESEGEKETQPSQVTEESAEHTLQRRKEIEAIQRAMEEENERVGTAQPRQSTSREEEEESSETKQSRGSQRGKFINFVAAKQHEVSKKVATKQKKRSTELLRLIDLDFSMAFSLLDLPPVNEYDMYIRNYGSANTKQAYVQCNEDNIDRDIQTEEIALSEKWTQHPPEHSGACGDPNLSQEARSKTVGEPNFDLKRLTAFLSSASQVMVVLLEEDQAERKSLRQLRTQTDTLSFSDGSLQLNTVLPFLYGRHISLMHFSQVQRHTMMSVHMPTEKPSHVRLDRCSIICIWNIWEPSRPQKILVYESEVQCCCFSPGKATLVFAGTSVGSVVLWDLREHTSNHYQMKIGEEEWTFRQPSFSTDAVMADSGHFSSVTSVEVVPSGVAGGPRPEVPMLTYEEDSSGLSFQLASLDETGVLNFWVVVELPKANEAGSPTDLGLRPGSKVKLLHSSSLLTVDSVSPQDAMKTGRLQTLHLKFLPTDSNHFFIGTNMGLVNHGTSHGLKAAPNFYRFQEPGVRPVEVSSIHFSPFRQNTFLVGCGDGSIRLHVLSHEQPVAEWNSSTAGEPVVSLQWAQTRPTVFCVLDADSNLHIWDLLKNETEPVVTERMNTDRVTAMAVFGDSGRQNIYSGIALAHESGRIEMQYLTSIFTLPISEEEEKLDNMITEVF